MAIRPLLVPLLAALLVGCGNDRTPPPDVVMALEPNGLQPYANKEVGIAFEAPANWRINTAAQFERLLTVTSGEATIAIWRYPRTEPPPADAAAIEAAKNALVERVRQRDPTFTLIDARTIAVDESKAIQITGDETIAGRRVRVRSTHLFHGGAELVVDAYAPERTFARVDARVFQPLVSSIDLTAPQA